MKKDNFTEVLILTIISGVMFVFITAPSIAWLVTSTWAENAGGSNPFVVALLSILSGIALVSGFYKLHKIRHTK